MFESSFCLQSYDGSRLEKNDTARRNAEEPTRKRTGRNANDREWSRSILNKSKKNSRVQNVVDVTEVSRTPDPGLQNLNWNLSNYQAPLCNGHLQQASGNFTESSHFGKSDSYQIAHDSSETCNTLINEEERENTLTGSQVKLEDSDGGDIELNRSVSTTEEDTELGDQCYTLTASLEGSKKDVDEAFFKEEVYDDNFSDDESDAGDMIGGFFEKSVDDIRKDVAGYAGELLLGYKSDHESQVRPCFSTITISHRQSRHPYIG